MDEETRYMELEYLGGNSRFDKSHLVLKKSSKPNTLIIERNEYKFETFEWHEKGTRNWSLAAIGFLIGAVLGVVVSQNPVGVSLGIVGAALLGWWQDTSIIILHLLDGDQKITLYARCDKQQFKKLSEFI